MDDPPTTRADTAEAGPALEAQWAALCPYCDYELTGLRASRCPECGACITETDVLHDARRRVFLALTRWRPLGLLALALLGGLWFTWGIADIPIALGIAAAWVVPARTPPGLVRRVRRRVWLMSLGWLYIPWLCLILAIPVTDWVYWNTSLLDWTDGDWEFIPEILGPAGAAAVLMIAFAIGVVLWRVRVRQLARATRLDEIPGYDPFPWKCAATRLAIGPATVVLVAWLLFSGAIQLLDWLMPNWGAG